MFKKKITDRILSRLREIFSLKSVQSGLDIDNSSIIFVQLHKQAAGHFELQAFFFEKIAGDVISNGQVNDAAQLEVALKAIKSKLPTGVNGVAISVATNWIATIRSSISRRMPEDQKLSHAMVELKRAFPDGYGELYYDFILEEGSESENKQTMLLVATQKAHVDDLLKATEASGLSVKTLDVDAYCLARTFPLIRSQLSLEGAEGAVAIANLDASGVLLIVMRNGELLYHKKEVIQSPELEKEISACFSPGEQANGEAARVAVETLKQMLDLVPTELENVSLAELVLAGRCTLLPQFSTMVSELVSPLPFRVANPFAEMTKSASIQAKEVDGYASAALLACGLAMHKGES